MTTSGLAAFSALAASAGHLDAEPLAAGRRRRRGRGRPSRDRCRCAPTILNPGRAATCLTIAAPIGPSPKCMTLMLGITCELYATPRSGRALSGGTMPSMATIIRWTDPRARRLGVSAAARSRSGERRRRSARSSPARATTAELRHHLITSAEFREQEPRLRAHQRSDPRHQGDRAGRPAVHRSVGSRDRPEHPARPLRGRRDRVRRDGLLEAGRLGDRRRRPHRVLHDADGGGGRPWRARLCLRAARRERRPARAIDRGERFRAIASASSAPRSAPRPGTATLTFPVETLNSGGAYLLRGGSAPLAGNQKNEVPLVALDALDLRRPVRFIKMDVEGAEPQVLRGAQRILAKTGR